MPVIQTTSGRWAIARLARYAISLSGNGNPPTAALAPNVAASLALAYFTAWQAWGKPLDPTHRAVAALVYGDQPIHPAALGRAITAALDQHEHLWREAVSAT